MFRKDDKLIESLLEKEKEIYELREEKRHREREKTLSMKEARLAMQEEAYEARTDALRDRNEARQISAVNAAKVELLQKQIKEAPYQVLSDLMKALLVKFPTIDIKNLSVTAKEKE